MKRIIIVALCLLLVCAGGAYYVQNSRVHKVQQFIEDIPGTLKADSITVSLIGKKVDIKGLKGSFQPFPNSVYELNIASITLEGLNTKANETPGVVKLVDRLLMHDLSWSSKGDAIVVLYNEAQYDSLDIQGLWANLGLLKRIESPNSKEYMELLQSLRFGPSTGAACKVSWMDRKVPYSENEKVINTVSFASYTAGSYTMHEYGAVEVSDMVYSNGTVTLNMGKLGLASGTNPSFALSSMLNSYSLLRLLSMVTQEGFCIRGLEITDFEMKMEGMEGAVTAPRLDLDIELTTKELLYHLQSDSLSVPAKAIGKTRPALAFLSQSMDSLNLRLLFTMDVNIAADSDWGNLDFRLELSEPELGDSLMTMSLRGKQMSGPGALMPFDTSTIGFSEAELKLTDRSFLERMFADAPGSEKGSGALRRAELAARQRARSEEGNVVGDALFETLGDFIEQSGTMQMTVKVKEHIPFIMQVLEPEAMQDLLRVTATHQPAH